MIFKDGINIKFPWTKEKEPKKPNLIKDIMNNPENFMLIASIEGDEVVVKVRRKYVDM